MKLDVQVSGKIYLNFGEFSWLIGKIPFPRSEQWLFNNSEISGP
jgi:hypothetical protein